MALLAAAASLMAGTSLAGAWGADATGAGMARSAAMPGGPVPMAEPSGSSVVVRWEPARFSDGTGVGGYEVLRQDADTGEASTAGGSCAGTVTATSCEDQVVPLGSWQYTVRAVQGAWSGDAGGASNVVVITAAE